MKETVNVNIGSMPFTLDTDAYDTLRIYFDEIRNRLPEDDTETLADIEARMGEILREKAPTPLYVISIQMVNAAIEQLGKPECFGDPHHTTNGPGFQFPNRLRRSRNNRSIAGVCGGIGECFNIDPTIVRLIALLLICFGGISIWVYVVLWLIIPEETGSFDPYSHKR